MENNRKKGLKVGTKGKAKLTRTGHTATEQGGYSYNDLLTLYTQALIAEGVSNGTLHNKLRAVEMLQRYAQYAGVEITPYTLTKEHCRAFISYMRNDHVKHANNHCTPDTAKTAGLTTQTINTHLRHMRAFYNWLVAEGYLQDNPFNYVKAVKEEIDTVDSLNETEIRKLLGVMDTRTFAGFRDYVLTMLLIDTGLRITEAVTLTADKIDFKTNIITVSADIAKSSKARYVPFSTKVSKLLRELAIEIQDLDTEYIFSTVYGNMLEGNIYRNRLKKYGKEAGISRNITVHQLRHTFAKLYLINGGDIYTLQKITGHASINTLRRYLQFETADIINKHLKHSPIKNLGLK